MTLLSGLKVMELTRAVWPVYLRMNLPSMTSVRMMFLSPPPLMNFELSLLMSNEYTSQLWMFLQFFIIRFRDGLQRLTLRSSEPVMQQSPWLLNFTVQIGPVCTLTSQMNSVGSLSIWLLRIDIIPQSIININHAQQEQPQCGFLRCIGQSASRSEGLLLNALFIRTCSLREGFFQLVQYQRMSKWTKTALDVLKETSRTFYIPIVKLPPHVQQAVASAYLCLRAIDQVQDHAHLSNKAKTEILQNISLALQTFSPLSTADNLAFNWGLQREKLPEVTLRLAEWVFYCPASFRGRVAECTASMAERMRYWADRNWRIDSQQDLDVYTMAVAGAVGLVLCEIWDWFQSTKTDRNLAIAYGRCLQSVNILRNSHEDSQRGVSFYPPKWTQADMLGYSKKNLKFGEKYLESLKQGTAARIFCEIPIALASATLSIIQTGGQKLSREQVLQICKIAV